MRISKRVNMIVTCCAVLFCMIFLTLSDGCKNPNDFHTGDTLVFPPAGPEPVAPANAYVFMTDQIPIQIFVTLEWTTVDSADIYEIEYQVDTFPPTVNISTINSWAVLIDDYSRLGVHQWRVRASNPLWKYYTEWSEQWYFEARWKPFAPALQYPPDDTVFLFDSLTPTIELQWAVVQDEEYYEVEVYQDSILYEHITVTCNSYVPGIDTGYYSWRVRAGSDHWQMWSYWSDQWNFEVHRR